MRKAVVYSMTRNLYDKSLPSIYSLCYYTKPDILYLIIEDDEFPYPVPCPFKIINANEQDIFPEEGPNYKTMWTYMALMKAALWKVIPEEDLVLYLDCDTIVVNDISDLWETKMDVNLEPVYLAGAREMAKTKPNGDIYVNMGVVLFNLKALRDGTGDEIIRRLNSQHYLFPEQDCINEVCRGRIREIDGGFNTTGFLITCPSDDIRIRHYAAQGNWYELPEFRKRRKEIKDALAKNTRSLMEQKASNHI